jgi:hypothetical protein
LDFLDGGRCNGSLAHIINPTGVLLMPFPVPNIGEVQEPASKGPP